MKENFENYIKNNLLKAPSFHPTYEKALNEMILAGGKRFRPLLLFTIIKTFNPELLEKSYFIGFAIECMHTYSLIHDDLPVMDDADLRRGHPTLHITYDEVIATLVGDALNTYSFELISDSQFNDKVKVELIKELAKNAGHNGMVLGQAIDCHYENKKLNLDQIKFMHKNKTGKCIAGPLKMGAIICEKDEELQNKLYDFGLNLGLLFQIQDDIFDVTKSEEEAGKTVAIDKNKNTFVNLCGLNGAILEAEKLVIKLEKELDSFDLKLKNNLSELLKKYIYRHQKIEIENQNKKD